MSDAWDAFVASLAPQALERERMRPPVDVELERPGSAEDTRMRTRHQQAVTDWHQSKRGHITPLLTEAEGWFLRSADRRLEQQRQTQMRAYARRKRAAA